MNMKPSAEELLAKYLDQEMSAVEVAAFEAELDANPELRHDLDEMKALSGFLQTQFVVRDIPHADFFSSQLSRRIAEEAVVKTPVASKWWQTLFVNPWMVPAMGMVTALLIAWTVFNPSQYQTPELVSNVYDPVTGLPLKSHYVAEAKAVVIDLNGSVEWNTDEKILPFYFNHRKSHEISASPVNGRKEVNGPDMAQAIEAQRPYNDPTEIEAASKKQDVVTGK